MMDAWSRRRAAVAAEEQAEAAAVAEAEREAEIAEKSDEELLAEHDLPDPETLEEGDDFKAFMAEAVPARLRHRALRRLWRLNPVLANIDGLVEYGEDYTDAATVVENLQTAYQVGKGMLKHVEELARQAEELAEGETEGDAEEVAASDPEPAEEPEQMIAQAELPAPDVPEECEPAVEAGLRVGSRRMQFTFEDEVHA